ncbi:MAG: glycosyltransferase family 9 protein [Planctomycetes bacterium]|nr:glycosyltransferase family 9 protein [Planctomycetota bacterium]
MLDLDPGEVRKILLVRTSALGDVVHTLPALDALRESFPSAEIHWLVEPLGARLLEGHPKLDRLVVLPRQRWKRDARSPLRWPAIAVEVLRLAAGLRRERYDLVIDFHGNLRSAAILALAGGRRRIGFHRADAAEAGGSLLTTHAAARVPPRTSKVEKNLALVRELGFSRDCPPGTLGLREEDRLWARALVASLPGSGPAVGLHPAVSRFGDLKRWPPERFRELIDLLREHHDARVLVTWGPGEREAAEVVGRPTVLPEEVGLLRFAAVLEALDLFIAADTGVLPIAALLGTPTVGLYGPKDAAVYGPYPRRGELVTSTAPCSPCTLRRCEHRICMALITAGAVLEAAERALAARQRGIPA